MEGQGGGEAGEGGRKGMGSGGNSSSRQLLSDISVVAERRMTRAAPPIMDACNRCLYGDLRRSLENTTRRPSRPPRRLGTTRAEGGLRDNSCKEVMRTHPTRQQERQGGDAEATHDRGGDGSDRNDC
ncbi:hypothetical protein E2C01_007553 [Portunus trituberculatus]|uniref:Uncharacterized protein n=1 Tax=Portunus trituberculatus TaxID=210409 RepID=A0A5B7CZR2_PORTR|nr:hypothetical protein [Portunus trituberculatus]